ncbi:MAG: CPBP family intramembrane metalloprotease [Chloroflexi bacterium]|nr:CPBP family intramembrane metalloprotease [Chloroflexota bacterium]
MTDHNSVHQPVPWKFSDIAIATAMVFASFFTILFLLRLAIDVTGTGEQAFPAPWFIGMFDGLMLGAVWVFGIKKYRARWQTLGLRYPSARGGFVLPLLALLGSLTFTGIYVTIVDALGADSLLPPPIPDEVLGDGFQRLVSTLVIGLWVPFTEEVFFRGFVLAGLIVPLGATRAAVVSSIIFAAAHLTLGTLVPIFVTGMLLAWLYLRTRSIWPPIIAHAAQNLLALSVAL